MKRCEGSWRNSKPSIHNNKNMFKRLLSSRFARNVALIATGTAGAQAIARLLNLQTIAPYLLLIPVAMFLNSLQQIMRQWLIRKKQFKVSAHIAITQSLILNSAKTGVGFIHPAGAALIVLSTLGSALYAAQLWLGARRWTAPEDHIHRPKEQLNELRSLAYQHRDFPIYRAPQVAINSFSQSFPVLMLAIFLGPVTLMY